jgi:hypothetical protein
MSANRFLYIVIALALAVAAVVTAYNAGATSAFSEATGAYDLVKQVRSDRDAAGVKSLYVDEQIPGSSLGPSYTLQVRPAVDSAYDLVEQIRGSSLGPSYTLQVRPTVDSSYDRLEELRVQRSVDAAYGGWIEKIEEIRLTRNDR